MKRSQRARRISAIAARRLGACAILMGLVAIITTVALSCGGVVPRVLHATPSPLSLEGFRITAGYSGDLASGAGATAVPGDLGLASVRKPNPSASSAVVMRADTGRVLFSRDPDTRRPMASTTKIMTALLVLEKLSLEREVAASARAQATDESQIDLRKGEVMTVRDLLSALLVGSANDAAVALAEAASGSVEAFVQEMNVKAASLGLANTHFANPHGLDAPGHYSSARDLATLARYALANPEFRRLVDTWECTVADVSGLSSRSLTNHNALLGQLDWVTGVKTGFTGDAGFCLVASGEKDGVSVISVVLGEAVKEECWKDSRSLLEYGLSRQRRLAVVDEGTVVAEAEVPYESAGTLRLVTKQAVELCLSPEDEIVITACVDGELRPPIEAGQPCGRLTVSVEGGEPRTVALVAEQDCPTPTLGTKLVYLWGRLSR